MTDKYSKYLTQKGMEQLLRTRLATSFSKSAYINKCTYAVANIKLNKQKTSNNKLIEYAFKLNLVETYSDLEKKIESNGFINIVNESGEWKIDFIKID